MTEPSPRRTIRWWPLYAILACAIVAAGGALLMPLSFIQLRSVALIVIFFSTVLFSTFWWLLFSRAPWRVRGLGFLGFLALAGLVELVFPYRGVTGNFQPIFEPRWAHAGLKRSVATKAATPALAASDRPDFPQYLGPDRNGQLGGQPALARDWSKAPPQVLWRQAIGPGWAGFAVVGNRAITLEQRGEEETITCLDVLTGHELWAHGEPAHFQSSFGGEGPRSVPTIAAGRVFTFGATGILCCLELESGKLLWRHDVMQEAGGGRPEWGYAGSPLVAEGKVYVSAGKSHGRSLFAYRVADGSLAWHEGSQPAEYSSPMLTTLAGVRQIVMFNMVNITAHDPESGAILWEYPWGIRQPQIAQPVPIGADKVVFSSGYGVGTELLQIKKTAEGKLAAERLWKTIRFQAKIAAFVHRDGFLYGLDDGILACLDVRNGSRKWKEGRYGHGQLLFAGDTLLVTAENGEIILLAPTPEAPNELGRFRVFEAKTWNPPAVSGDLLLTRTDREAACVRLPTVR